jgi:hypothetical protein
MSWKKRINGLLAYDYAQAVQTIGSTPTLANNVYMDPHKILKLAVI